MGQWDDLHRKRMESRFPHTLTLVVLRGLSGAKRSTILGRVKVNSRKRRIITDPWASSEKVGAWRQLAFAKSPARRQQGLMAICRGKQSSSTGRAGPKRVSTSRIRRRNTTCKCPRYEARYLAKAEAEESTS